MSTYPWWNKMNPTEGEIMDHYLNVKRRGIFHEMREALSGNDTVDAVMYSLTQGKQAESRRPETLIEWFNNNMPDRFRGTDEYHNLIGNEDLARYHSDRPDLIHRLDAAEERIRVLTKDRDILEKKLIQTEIQVAAFAKNHQIEFQGRIKAESIAKKYDYVCADLEKCRVAMGTIQFEKVIGCEN